MTTERGSVSPLFNVHRGNASPVIICLDDVLWVSGDHFALKSSGGLRWIDNPDELIKKWEEWILFRMGVQAGG